MRYIANRKIKFGDREYSGGEEIPNFESAPPRNQRAMLDLEWVKIVLNDEVIPNKSKTKKINKQTE